MKKVLKNIAKKLDGIDLTISTMIDKLGKYYGFLGIQEDVEEIRDLVDELKEHTYRLELNNIRLKSRDGMTPKEKKRYDELVEILKPKK